MHVAKLKGLDRRVTLTPMQADLDPQTVQQASVIAKWMRLDGDS